MVSSSIPPKKLWLELDNSKLDFEDKQQINIILNYIPESYELLEELDKNTCEEILPGFLKIR